MQNYKMHMGLNISNTCKSKQCIKKRYWLMSLRTQADVIYKDTWEENFKFKFCETRSRPADQLRLCVLS
jgi:hypothetical protein